MNKLPGVVMGRSLGLIKCHSFIFIFAEWLRGKAMMYTHRIAKIPQGNFVKKFIQRSFK